MGALLLEYVGDAQVPIVRMLHLLPQRPAPARQPCIQIGETAESLLARFNPDTPAAVLHVLLDDAFLPAAGYVAEVRVKQRWCAHITAKREFTVRPLPLWSLSTAVFMLSSMPRRATPPKAVNERVGASNSIS